MLTRAQIIEMIETDFRSDPEVCRACHSVIEYICSSSKDNLKHIAFFNLKKVINTHDDSLVINVARYFSGDSLPIINICFEFIEGDFIEQVSLEDFRRTQLDNKYYHPETGELVKDFESKIFMYFSLSKLGWEVECN
ncbi:hypothetical protein VY657_003973 [Salmonella enterica]|nr:hypothetical protein [Salmonella enterica]HBJ6761324.1 hypothetical protein [Salmonella enterica subsp. houtenae serovar 48:g,z51:-]EDC3623092.1 hypothetical protein [Salmonella enterica]EDJ1071706.1 hypothetical protein [Salmonella enterica]EEG6732919.1 hypothetical protein [Salmonella enterica]